MADLFDTLTPAPGEAVGLAPDAWLLPGFAGTEAQALLADLLAVAEESPFRHLVTPGGATMSVAMTNCGGLGWISDRRGYRYEPVDPLTSRSWPTMPDRFLHLARRASDAAGFPGFAPDACLINRYVPRSKLSLHQDRDELDLDAPIVSVSLGLPAVFMFGGQARGACASRHRLQSGDVAVWGGASRLAFHGIAPLADGTHHLTGPFRYNLTFRKVTSDSGSGAVRSGKLPVVALSFLPEWEDKSAIPGI
ncbi:MAG: DNA oxidative demethylase AlkB [Janthinobacterium lividum]